MHLFFALGYNWVETDLILNIAINIVKYYNILTNLQKNGTKYMYSNERCLIFDESGNLGADGRYFVISCIDTMNAKSLHNIMKRKLKQAGDNSLNSKPCMLTKLRQKMLIHV